MANTQYISWSWVSGSEDFDMPPGESNGHYCDIGYGDVVSISAQPVGQGRNLAVEDLQFTNTGNPSRSCRVNFAVRNLGPRSVVGYIVCLSIVSE